MESFTENNAISLEPSLFACVTKIPANLYGLHSYRILIWEMHSIHPSDEEWGSRYICRTTVLYLSL